ncbi:MAG: hypothetical protein AAFY60_17495, partial [Myxococcota bacterium]
EALNVLTGRLLMGQAYEEAARLNQRVMEIEPQNVKGQTYNAMMQAVRGDPEGAKSRLEELASKHGENALDAFFFRGMIAMGERDTPAMQKYIGRWVELAPPSPRRDRFKAMLSAPMAAPQ